MNTQQQAHRDLVRAEIMDDMMAGNVPLNPRSYSRLHDYVDANMYAEDQQPEDLSDWPDFINPITDALNAELREGTIGRTVLAQIIRAELPEGYTLDDNAPTGGGCRAFYVQRPDGSHMLVTDGEADLPFSGLHEDTNPESPDYSDEFDGLGFGYYEADGDPIGWTTVPAAMVAPNRVREHVRAWVAGEPIATETY